MPKQKSGNVDRSGNQSIDQIYGLSLKNTAAASSVHEEEPENLLQAKIK
tara:strand:+ start:715 stop:861 length:147 start_codon:yes stop_codon:yes gene_type:complete